MKTNIFKLTAFVALIMMSPSVWAMGEVEFVQNAYARLSVMHTGDGALNEQTVAEIKQLFDFDAFSHHCLQDIEGKMTSTQLTEFKTLFGNLFFTNISKKGMKLGDKSLTRMKYKLENRAADASVVTVRGQVKNQEVSLSFSLISSGDSWKIADLSVEGVSLSRNYRGQFNRIFREEHYEGLTSRMQKKLTDMTSVAQKDK